MFQGENTLMSTARHRKALIATIVIVAVLALFAFARALLMR